MTESESLTTQQKCKLQSMFCSSLHTANDICDVSNKYLSFNSDSFILEFFKMHFFQRMSNLDKFDPDLLDDEQEFEEDEDAVRAAEAEMKARDKKERRDKVTNKFIGLCIN